MLDTLAPVPKDRKCFRLINGVLVERTAGDIIPALETTAEGLKKVLEGLVKDYKKKQEEMEAWKVGLFLLWFMGWLLTYCVHQTKNNVQVVSQ